MDPEERQNDDYSLPARRQNDLLRLAQSRGQVMVNDLAEHFGAVHRAGFPDA